MYIAAIFAAKNINHIKSENAALLTPARSFTGNLPEFLTQYASDGDKPDLILIDAPSLFGLSTHDKANGHYAADLTDVPHIIVDEKLVRTGGYYTKMSGQRLNIIRLMELAHAKDAKTLLDTFKGFADAKAEVTKHSFRRSDPVAVNTYVFDLYAPALPRNRR